ncbi:MAG: hypothetical protein WCS94_15630 [Verrucomicrobiota bacterium]
MKRTCDQQLSQTKPVSTEARSLLHIWQISGYTNPNGTFSQRMIVSAASMDLSLFFLASAESKNCSQQRSFIAELRQPLKLEA